MRLPPIWESGVSEHCGCQKIRWKLTCIMRILWMCLDSCTPCTNTNTVWSFSCSTIATILTSTYINSISRVKTRKLSIRFCEWICQFPTWRRRYCLNILATRMTWRYISHNSLLSGLSFRHSNNHLWRVTCHGNVGNVPLLSFAWPLLLPAQLNYLTNFAYSQFRKTTLCLWVNLYYRIREHTHTILILIISFCDWYRWGWPKCSSRADFKPR